MTTKPEALVLAERDLARSRSRAVKAQSDLAASEDAYERALFELAGDITDLDDPRIAFLMANDYCDVGASIASRILSERHPQLRSVLYGRRDPNVVLWFSQSPGRDGCADIESGLTKLGLTISRVSVMSMAPRSIERERDESLFDVMARLEAEHV